MLALPPFRGAAGAQQIDRIVVFGDTYADTGNLFRLLGIIRRGPGSTLTGRFSGGTNYIDTLVGAAHVPVVQFCDWRGADQQPQHQTAGAPGFTYRSAAFLAGGGRSASRPSTGLDQNDLVAVSIGGNDARAYQHGGGMLAGCSGGGGDRGRPAFSTNFDQLVTRGRRPSASWRANTGLLPEIATNPVGAAIRTAYSTPSTAAFRDVSRAMQRRGVDRPLSRSHARSSKRSGQPSGAMASPTASSGRSRREHDCAANAGDIWSTATGFT